MNPSDYLNDPSLQTAQTAATNASSAYQTAAANDVSLPTMLRQALMDKFTNNNPLINDLNSAQTNYLNVAKSAPNSVLPENNGGHIFNPIQQEDLINQRKTAALSPVMLLNTLLGLQTGGIGNIIDATSKASQAKVTGLKGAADTAQQTYANLLDLLKSKSSTALEEQKLGLQYGSNLSPQKKLANTNSLAQEAQQGRTLDQLMRKYKTLGLSPDEIYQTYNTYSSHGIAKENPLDLQNKYGISLTEGDKKRAVDLATSANAAKDALNSVDNIYNTWKNGVAPNILTRTLAKGSESTGISGLSSAQTKINSTFYDTMIKDIKAAVGGRVTNQEIGWFKQYALPNATDTDASAKAKIEVLKGAITRKIANPNYDITTTPLGTTPSSGGTWH